MYQSLFEELASGNPKLELHPGLPDRDMLNTLAAKGGHNLVVLDDLQEELGRDSQMEKMFTQMAHHLHMSIIFLGNNLYHKNFSRTITVNLHVLILFKNARDAQQIHCLARQLYPHKWRKFVGAYADCTEKPYGYLVVDLSPQANSQLRLRTNIFCGEDPIIYML